MRRMWDAAFPPASPPPWEAVAGYIGGNTPHVWTDQEWARQPARWRLPIFTRSTGGDPNTDAAQAVRWLRAHGVPPGVCVALDYETRIDPDYLRVFDWIIQQAGYLTLLYGTRRTVVQNPRPSGGYWVAEWTGTPHLYPGSAATQWSGSGPFGGAYDPNLVADSTPLWDTQKEMFMTLTDAEQSEILRAARQINGAVASGQTSFETTIEAILATVQALANIVRQGQGTLAGNIADVRSAVLGAVAALPAPQTPEQAETATNQILEALRNLGVEGLSADAVLDALSQRLAA